MTYPNSVTIEENSDTGSSSDSIKETGHTNQQIMNVVVADDEGRPAEHWLALEHHFVVI